MTPRARAGRSDELPGVGEARPRPVRRWLQLQINGQPVTIVGIAPQGFYGERLSATPPAFWMPMHLVATSAPATRTCWSAASSSG